MKKAKIAAAAGIASGGGANDLGKRIEAAMAAEVAKCFAEGVMDDRVILERKLEARRKVKEGR